MRALWRDPDEFRGGKYCRAVKLQRGRARESAEMMV